MIQIKILINLITQYQLKILVLSISEYTTVCRLPIEIKHKNIYKQITHSMVNERVVYFQPPISNYRKTIYENK